jgi:transposase-like protein
VASRKLVGALAAKGINFRSLTDSIDTGTPSGRFFFHVMASLAEMERELMVERTQAGLKAARQQGRTGGRQRQMTDNKISAAKKLLAGGVAPRDVARNLGVSVPTLYRWVPASALDSVDVTSEEGYDAAVSREMRMLGKPATNEEREPKIAPSWSLPLYGGCSAIISSTLMGCTKRPGSQPSRERRLRSMTWVGGTPS